MDIYDLDCISTLLRAILILYIHCIYEIKGTSIKLVNANCPHGCGNTEAQICTGNCTTHASNCISNKFNLTQDYFQQFDCDQTFSGLILSKIYDSHGNHVHTLCENGTGRSTFTCLHNTTKHCFLENNLEILTNNNRFLIEIELGEQCNKSVQNVLPIILTVLGVVALIAFVTILVFYIKKGKKVEPEEDIINVDTDRSEIPFVLREKTEYPAFAPSHHRNDFK